MKSVDISIIIATRNRESILRTSIDKACSAIEGQNAEIIVVNDGHKTLMFSENISKKITLLENAEQGVSVARNRGAFHSKGSILFFIDDDMWITPEIISWITKNLIHKEIENAVYNINWEYPPSLNQKLKNSKIGRFILSTGYNTMWGRMNINGRQPANGLFPFNALASCSLVLPKSVFEKIGGYNEAIKFQGEDIELSKKILQYSIPLYCVFDTTLYHNHEDRLDLAGYLLRAKKGYYSQFMAESQKIIPYSMNNYKKPYTYLLNASHFFEKGWILFYKLLPNHKIFDLISGKVIGYLGGLEKYKQWKIVMSKSQ